MVDSAKRHHPPRRQLHPLITDMMDRVSRFPSPPPSSPHPSDSPREPALIRPEPRTGAQTGSSSCETPAAQGLTPRPLLTAQSAAQREVPPMTTTLPIDPMIDDGISNTFFFFFFFFFFKLKITYVSFIQLKFNSNVIPLSFGFVLKFKNQEVANCK